MPEGEQFLHKRDPKIHTSEEVMHEQSRQKELKSRNVVGAEISQKPDAKIASWFKVLEMRYKKVFC